MKIFEFNEGLEMDYPEDMAKILTYLDTVGEVHVPNATIERCYYDWSKITYSVEWVHPIGEDLLKDFAVYLSKQEI